MIQIKKKISINYKNFLKQDRTLKTEKNWNKIINLGIEYIKDNPDITAEMIKVQLRIASCYIILGKYNKSLEYATNSREKSEYLGNIELLAVSYYLLSICHKGLYKTELRIRNLTLSSYYILQAEDLINDVNQVTKYKILYNKISLYQDTLNNHNDLKEDYKEIFKLLEKLNNKEYLNKTKIKYAEFLFRDTHKDCVILFPEIN